MERSWSTHTEYGFIRTVPARYLRFDLQVEKDILPCCCKDAFKLVILTFERQGSWQRRNEAARDLEGARIDGTILIPGKPFHLCLPHME